MRRPPQVHLLPDGRRLHLQDGPIDLVVRAYGTASAVAQAYRAAAATLTGLLDRLCDELPALRAPAGVPSDSTLMDAGGWRPSPLGGEGRHLPSSGTRDGGGAPLIGPVARCMAAAVAPFAAETFITPMAAVAGAVADAILGGMLAAADLDRAFVNNGGDIALFVQHGHRFTVGLVDRPDNPGLFGRCTLDAASGIRGIATSGWRGRSFSRGIADGVTVLARTAAEADAAATVVANAVDLPGHPAVRRAPADSIAPDSDLGARLVTRDVGPLAGADIATALAAGAGCAEALLGRGLIAAAAIQLQGRVRVVGDPGGAPLALSRVPAARLSSVCHPEVARHA